MDKNIIKYRLVEQFLNKIEFKNIKVGNLLAEKLALNYYNADKISFIKNLFILVKYCTIFPLSKQPKQTITPFIFTKLTNRLHFNELMDPLVLHFLDKSTIICDEKSFDPELLAIHPIYSHVINASQTISNNKEDTGRILLTTFKVFTTLLNKKKRLRLSCNEILDLVTSLLIQLRRVSYWDEYFKTSVIKPKCIVTECDRMGLSSPLILSARNYNILTITLTHGVICEYGFIPMFAKYRFCWGKFQKNQLIAFGVAPGRILITGNPIIKGGNQHSEKYLHSFDGITVCLAISPEDKSLNKSLIEIFIQAVQQFENLKGIIKLHPSLKKDNYKWINTIPSKISVIEMGEITNNELFKTIDLLIVYQSGIANEALASGTPVMILEPTGLSNLNFLQTELNQKAGCKIATNKKELTEIFEEIIENPELFRTMSIKKCGEYLGNLFETTGEESIRIMISEIDRLTGENDSIKN